MVGALWLETTTGDHAYCATQIPFQKYSDFSRFAGCTSRARDLGALLGRLGDFLGRLGAILDCLGAVLARTEAVVSRS
eukprot:3747240-Pyramimonas_sp.AAC.1